MGPGLTCEAEQLWRVPRQTELEFRLWLERITMFDTIKMIDLRRDAQ
jgi:hypothetical protein